ncbi:MAG: hypothetical protein Q9P90_19240 [candidate division KSB1 bacterium]|nr:hypothetical protein [candidate division KSB1 bacterium]
MKWSIKLMALALALGIAALANAQTPSLFPFPHRVNDYVHQKTESTLKAHMDNGDTLRYQNARVLYTSKRDSVWVYWSRFENETDARRMMEQMIANLRLNMADHQHQSSEMPLGVKVHSAASKGKAHYFFRHRDQIFWLTGSPNECNVFLKAFIQHAGLARNDQGRS